MSVTLAPPMFSQFLNQNNSGSPAVGYQLFTYQAGTSIKQATWTDSTQTSQNANPVELDGNGVGTFWGDPTLPYKFVWAPANDTDPPTSPLRTLDNFYFPVTAGALSVITGVPILASYARTTAEIAASAVPVNYAYQPGDVRRFGVVGSGDESTKINTALSVSGWVWIPPFLSVTCNENLTIIGGTTFQIDGTLTLQTSRMIAYRPNGFVKILGSGWIYSNSLNTTDALPTGWQGLGIINFGGISGAYAAYFEFKCNLKADFSGTPGSITIGFNDKRRGIALQYVQDVNIHDSLIGQTTAESIFHFGDTGDLNIHIHHNMIWAGNHDCISPAESVCYTFITDNNIMWGALNGIETNVGVHTNNVAYNMVASGFSNGGNSIPQENPLVFRGNVGYNNGTDFSLQQGSGTDGTLIVQNNTSYSPGQYGFIISFCDTLVFTGNTAQAWGRAVAAPACSISNINTIFLSDNHLFEEGANSTGGFAVNALSRLVIGSGNTTSGVVIPWQNSSLAGQNQEPTPIPVASQVISHSVTGTTAATTLYSYTIHANTLGYAGGFRVRAGGTLTGTAGNKVLSLEFGGTNFAGTTIPAATTGAWSFEGVVMNVASTSSQNFVGTLTYGSTVVPVSGAIAIATTSNQTVSMVVTLVNAADTVTQNVFVVEPLAGALQS